MRSSKRPYYITPTIVLFLLSSLALNGVSANTGTTHSPPSTASRYTDADRYLGENVDRLIDNRDPAAHFVDHGKGVLYRLKDGADVSFLYRNLTSGEVHQVTTSAILTNALQRAMPNPTVLERPEFRRFEYDSNAGSLNFAALGKRWSFTQSGGLVEAPRIEAADPSVSPDGHFRITARDFNLFATDLRSGREVALTHDGTRDRPYGRGIAPLSLIIAQNSENPEMPPSIRWSPDSRRVLTWRLDTRGVEPMSLTQHSPPGSLLPKSYSYIYPLAGSAILPSAQTMVIDVREAVRRKAARIVPLQIPPEALTYPAEPNMDWIDGRPRIRWTARGYKQIVIYTADPKDGSVKVAARETVRPLVNITSTDLRPVPAMGGELVISERSGWAQLYLVRPDAPDQGAPLTTGDWEVISVDHVSQDGRTLLIEGVGREHDRSPYYKALYRLSLDGGPPKLLTPEPIDHETEVSPDGEWVIDRMSDATEPTRTVLRSAENGHVVAELAKADPKALLASGFTPPEPFDGVAADGKTPLHGMIFRPAGFDPARRYPVIDNIYTAPTQTNVPTSWDETILSTSNSVAQIGAVVVMIDGRGTSRRGQQFRLASYQNLGEVGLDDHIAMIRQMAARYPNLDTTRIGVFGGSAGGYDAARFILRRPEFVKVAVASSGNHDLRLDKAWWAESSMGDADAATWERNSNIPIAGNLKGKLLLIHGELDDNVPVVESYRLEAALIRAGKQSDLLILPNVGHRLGQPAFWRALRDFLTTNLIDDGSMYPSATAVSAATTDQSVTRARALCGARKGSSRRDTADCRTATPRAGLTSPIASPALPRDSTARPLPAPG